MQVVITSLWAAITVVASTFGYTTMRTGAHMADTGTEHNIELIVGVRVQLLSTPMTVTTLAKISNYGSGIVQFCDSTTFNAR